MILIARHARVSRVLESPEDFRNSSS